MYIHKIHKTKGDKDISIITVGDLTHSNWDNTDKSIYIEVKLYIQIRITWPNNFKYLIFIKYSIQ